PAPEPAPHERPWLPQAQINSLLGLLIATGNSLNDPWQEPLERVWSPLYLIELHILQEKWLSPEEHGESPYPQRWFKVSYKVGAGAAKGLKDRKACKARREIAEAWEKSQQELWANHFFPQGLLHAADLLDMKHPHGLPFDEFEKYLVGAARNNG